MLTLMRIALRIAFFRECESSASPEGIGLL